MNLTVNRGVPRRVAGIGILIAFSAMAYVGYRAGVEHIHLIIVGVAWMLAAARLILIAKPVTMRECVAVSAVLTVLSSAVIGLEGFRRHVENETDSSARTLIFGVSATSDGIQFSGETSYRFLRFCSENMTFTRFACEEIVANESGEPFLISYSVVIPGYAIRDVSIRRIGHDYADKWFRAGYMGRTRIVCNLPNCRLTL